MDNQTDSNMQESRHSFEVGGHCQQMDAEVWWGQIWKIVMSLKIKTIIF